MTVADRRAPQKPAAADSPIRGRKLRDAKGTQPKIFVWAGDLNVFKRAAGSRLPRVNLA